MPYWNKLFAAMALSALFSAPALADGTTGKTINRGPPPLEAKVLTPPRAGCKLTEDGRHWACPAREKKTVHTPTRRVVHHKPNKTVRRVVKTSAPTSKGLTLDTSGFNGGVGAGVDGGYYGGGGTIILTGGSKASGFSQRVAFRSTYRSGGRTVSGSACGR